MGFLVLNYELRVSAFAALTSLPERDESAFNSLKTDFQ